jgi:N-acetylmuramic acid 6-phosphate etherase
VTEPATEGVSPRYVDIETWPAPTVMQALWEGQLAAVAALQPALAPLAAACSAAADRLRRGGRLAYAGAGTSGRIGVQDGAELGPTFDWPADRLVFLMAGGEKALIRAAENAEDRDDLALDDVTQAGLGGDDVLVGLAASGSTPYTVGCVLAARQAGALTIGIANSPGSRLLEAAEHPILIETGPEAIAGSTRMKAGTAQKAALNLFSTSVMTLLGRVYRGRMVDMLARNEKLRRRAVRMLRELTGATTEQAAAALTQAGGRVKPAVLIVRGLRVAEAEALLARHGGDLRRAEAALGAEPSPAVDR